MSFLESMMVRGLAIIPNSGWPIVYMGAWIRGLGKWGLAWWVIGCFVPEVVVAGHRGHNGG